MIELLKNGQVVKDIYLQNEYEKFLAEHGETLETNEDYIPYVFGGYTYVCMKESEYKQLSAEDINCLLSIMN